MAEMQAMQKLKMTYSGELIEPKTGQVEQAKLCSIGKDLLQLMW